MLFSPRGGSLRFLNIAWAFLLCEIRDEPQPLSYLLNFSPASLIIFYSIFLLQVGVFQTLHALFKSIVFGIFMIVFEFYQILWQVENHNRLFDKTTFCDCCLISVFLSASYCPGNKNHYISQISRTIVQRPGQVASVASNWITLSLAPVCPAVRKIVQWLVPSNTIQILNRFSSLHNKTFSLSCLRCDVHIYDLRGRTLK